MEPRGVRFPRGGQSRPTGTRIGRCGPPGGRVRPLSGLTDPRAVAFNRSVGSPKGAAPRGPPGEMAGDDLLPGRAALEVLDGRRRRGADGARAAERTDLAEHLPR